MTLSLLGTIVSRMVSLARQRGWYKSLKAWRRAAGLSQIQAARVLNMSQTTYSRLERQARGVRPQRLKAIMATTGVPADVLLGIAS